MTFKALAAIFLTITGGSARRAQKRAPVLVTPLD
jgi:hypothetical protein